MISEFSILLPVEYDLFDKVVNFYRNVLELSVSEEGESDLGNPFLTFDLAGCTTLTIHTGRDGKFPYPEFRPTGHGVAFAIKVRSVDVTCSRLRNEGVEILNGWEYRDGTKAISIADPAGNVMELWGEG